MHFLARQHVADRAIENFINRTEIAAAQMLAHFIAVFDAVTDAMLNRADFAQSRGRIRRSRRVGEDCSGAAETSGSESGDQVIARVTAQVAAFCRDPEPAKAIMAELAASPVNSSSICTMRRAKWRPTDCIARREPSPG